MPLSDRELLARLIKCEAGGEGDTGMYAMASVVSNRTTVPYGEFHRISNGGDIRAIIQQPSAFTCMMTTVGGSYNSQNVYNMDPDEIDYEIADWAIAGNSSSEAGESLFYFNPYNPNCPPYFPRNGTGVVFNRVRSHCFYTPTQKYAQT